MKTQEQIQFTEALFGVKDGDRISLIMIAPFNSGCGYVTKQIPASWRVPDYVNVVDLTDVNDQVKKSIYDNFPKIEYHALAGDETICHNQYLNELRKLGIPIVRGNQCRH